MTFCGTLFLQPCSQSVFTSNKAISEEEENSFAYPPATLKNTGKDHKRRELLSYTLLQGEPLCLLSGNLLYHEKQRACCDLQYLTYEDQYHVL